MIKNILNKLPRKQTKLVDHRDGGSSTYPSNASTTSRSSYAVGSRSGNSNTTIGPGISSTSNSGPSYGNKLHDALNTKVNGNAGPVPYEALPSFRDVPNAEKQNLFIKKLSLCCVVFDFTDPVKNLKRKRYQEADISGAC
ncbi:UNVERIFIED_CONTAM: Serine/threonine protein phosphatase 2A regulatory subunit B' theta isoform [Sesamum radiatum]|uniref:Serine/threonine protein phosphatase 2A regulatory subunit B' theta isoform n=1 Tax=Sesamum radiatum TaxID=300843 RepID=A0AAW2V6G4_SESRA